MRHLPEGSSSASLRSAGTNSRPPAAFRSRAGFAVDGRGEKFSEKVKILVDALVDLPYIGV